MTVDRRTFLTTGATLLAGAAAGCAGAQRDTGALRSKADALLRDGVQSGDIPGVVAAVTTPTQTLYEAAFGERVLGQAVAMTPDTVMWIASMTKPVVGTAAMQLVEQGRLELDAPAAKVIPELATFQVIDGWDANGQVRTRPAKRQMTLRHLLTHTSGFVYDIWNADMARFVKTTNLPRAGSGRNSALRTPLAFDPGERWEYGIGIDWTGKMIEAVSGMRLGAYLKQNILDPLGMSSTAFKITPDMRARLAKVHARAADGKLTVTAFEVPQDPEFEPGGGGLYSSAQDYQRFMRMIMNGGQGNGNQVVSARTVELMSQNAIGALRVNMLPSFNPALSRDAEFFPGSPKSWGLTFMINEETAPTGRSAGSLAWAGLANTYFWIDRKKNVSGVYLSQILPFVDVKSLPLFLAFEKTVYQTVA
jgi:CubicO group peptidase (beta-lactamase class C family)